MIGCICFFAFDSKCFVRGGTSTAHGCVDSQWRVKQEVKQELLLWTSWFFRLQTSVYAWKPQLFKEWRARLWFSIRLSSSCLLSSVDNKHANLAQMKGLRPRVPCFAMDWGQQKSARKVDGKPKTSTTPWKFSVFRRRHSFEPGTTNRFIAILSHPLHRSWLPSTSYLASNTHLDSSTSYKTVSHVEVLMGWESNAQSPRLVREFLSTSYETVSHVEALMLRLGVYWF